MVQLRSEVTRKRVIRAAAALFAKNGRENVSIQEICEASGVSNGSLFHHFGSKNGIALAVYLHLRETYWRCTIDAIRDFDGEPIAAIGAGIRAAMEFQELHAAEHVFMIECASSEWVRKHTGPVQQLNAHVSAQWHAWADAYIAAGHLPDLPEEVYAAIVFGPSQWLARAWQTDLIDRSPSSYADVLLPLFTNSLRAACTNRDPAKTL